MKEIQRYILEKLKINKDSNVKYLSHNEFELNDPIVCISLFWLKGNTKANIQINKVRKFKNYYEKSSRLELQSANGKDLTLRDVKINSNDIFEFNYNKLNGYDQSSCGIYLNIKDAIKFIKDILLDFDESKIKLLYNYFDKEDEFIDDWPFEVKSNTIKLSEEILQKYDRH